MIAEQLDGGHIGKQVTVGDASCRATGVLTKVDHRCNVIADNQLGGGVSYSIGKRWVELEFLGNLSITVRNDAEVWIG